MSTFRPRHLARPELNEDVQDSAPGEAADHGAMMPVTGRDSSGATRNTVLVIEDSDPVRKALAKMLAVEGFKVLEARDGSEAVHLYSAHSAEIVAATLDMMMPTTDGRETLAMLSEFAPNLPIVISSAAPTPDNLIGRVPGSPGVGYLQKPYSAEELATEIRRVIAEIDAAE